MAYGATQGATENVRHSAGADLPDPCTTGDDLGLIEHPAPNVEPGDVLVLPDGREALVTARVEAASGQLVALLEVAIAPTPLTSGDAIA
jgi:hypothetical protein